MGTLLHGIACSESIDSSGEKLMMNGLDISTFVPMGVANFEHSSKEASQIVGKVLEAKKIFSKEDCETEGHLYFWEISKVPFLYSIVELFDDTGHSGAQDVAAMAKWQEKLFEQGKIDFKTIFPVVGWSIEGSTLEKQSDGRITSSLAKKVSVTVAPCHKRAYVRVYNPEKSAKKPENRQKSDKFKEILENIFKSEISLEQKELIKSEIDSIIQPLPPIWSSRRATKTIKQAPKQEGPKNLVTPSKNTLKIGRTHNADTNWYTLGKEVCSTESKAVGHCGNLLSHTSGDNLISLRTSHKIGDKEYHEPHVTFVANKGFLTNLKGKGDISKHHEHIVHLLKNPSVKGIFSHSDKSKRTDNFKFSDLSQELQKEVLKHNPNLITDTDSPENHEKILNADIPEHFSHIKKKIALSPSLDSKHHEKLVNDKDWEVRRAIAKNPKLDSKFHDRLVNDEHWNVQTAMKNNSSYIPSVNKSENFELEPLEKGKKDIVKMFGNEAQDHHHQFADWAAKTLPNQNWQVWAAKNYRNNPKSFTKKTKETLEHFSGSKHIPEIASVRFEKDHDLKTGIDLFKKAEKVYNDKLKKNKNLVTPKSTTTHFSTTHEPLTNWHDLGISSCTAEGKAMGHCGNAASAQQGDRILSLRTTHKIKNKEYHEPHLTFINNEGFLGEMKGRGNEKPAPHYHEHIVHLLKNPSIKGIFGGGYLKENNFKFSDLSQELQKEVLKHNPNLITDTDSPENHEKILNADIPEHFSHIKKKIALSPNLDSKFHEKLVNDGDWDVRYAIAKNPNLDSKFHEKLVNDEDRGVRCGIAKNPNLDSKFHEKLVNDEYWDVRHTIAQNPNLDQKFQEKLVNDKDWDVRRAIAQNPNLDSKFHEKLVNDKDRGVRRAMENNPNYKPPVNKSEKPNYNYFDKRHNEYKINFHLEQSKKYDKLGKNPDGSQNKQALGRANHHWNEHLKYQKLALGVKKSESAGSPVSRAGTGAVESESLDKQMQFITKGELEKAKVDQGKTKQEKQWDREERHHVRVKKDGKRIGYPTLIGENPKDVQSGIHTQSPNTGNLGVSDMGYTVRNKDYYQTTNKLKNPNPNKQIRSFDAEVFSDSLSQSFPKQNIRQQIKTNLPKSEKGELEKAPIIFEADEKNPHTTIYRVQNSRGKGPYTTSGLQGGSAWWSKPHISPRHPTPRTDRGFTPADRYDLNEKHRFGFESEEQAKKWFSKEEMEKLNSYGFKLTPVKASKVWGSKKQVFYEHYKEPEVQGKKLAASELSKSEANQQTIDQSIPVWERVQKFRSWLGTIMPNLTPKETKAISRAFAVFKIKEAEKKLTEL
jgi:hypothetical protein